VAPQKWEVNGYSYIEIEDDFPVRWKNTRLAKERKEKNHAHTLPQPLLLRKGKAGHTKKVIQRRIAA